MNNTALAIIQPDELETIQRTAKLLATSGYFGNADGITGIAQVAAKIMAGRELGFGPFASVNGVHIIQGKPAIGANLMASAVKSSGRYTYKVLELTATVCRIEFFELRADKWVSAGISEYTFAEATTAQLAGKDMWKKYPKNMLFARAMSNGVRFYAPDVFSGNVVYVPEELGADVDGDGNVIDGTATLGYAPQANTTSVTPDKPTNGSNGLGHAITVEIAQPQPENPFEADSPTDEEHDILSMWMSSSDAYVWAVNVGACLNVFEAKNSMKNLIKERGGATAEDKNDLLLAFLRKQNKKLEAQPEAA